MTENRNLLSNDISDALEDAFDLEDDNRVAKDMVVVEPKSVEDIKKENKIIVADLDFVEDYNITRLSLQEALEQSKHILKAGTELFKDNPNTGTLKVLPELIVAINKTAENIFNNQMKVLKNIQELNKNKEPDDEDEGTTKDFLKSMKEKNKK